MLSKHISSTSTKILIFILMVAVMVGIGASKGYSASSVKPLADSAPSREEQPVSANNADLKLIGNSALLKPMASAAMSTDTTPNHNLVVGGAKSSIRYDKSEQVDKPTLPHIPSKAEEKPVKETAPNGFVYSPEIPLSKELQEFTYKRCQEMNLDYPTILALMWRESRFNIYAVGYNTNGTSDSGIMQINDVNRGWLSNEMGITNLMDPYQNITAGTELLGRLTRDHGQHYGLLAYQYGEQGMKNRVASGVTTSSLTELLYGKSTEFQAMLNRAA